MIWVVASSIGCLFMIVIISRAMLGDGRDKKRVQSLDRESAKESDGHAAPDVNMQHVALKVAAYEQARIEKMMAPLPRPVADSEIDRMRAGLQKVAYTMVGKGVSDDDRARFKQDMTDFANADPQVKEIAVHLRELVDACPGRLQSNIYDCFPEYSKEQVRYALYFAHELGWIHRKKSGRSYQLFPPGKTVDSTD